MKKILFLLICFLVWSKNAFSQTTLAPGDISLLWFSSITGQTAPDEFGFITFVDLSPGTLIYFTDNGVSSAGVLDGGEQLMVYTVNSVISAGTVISFNGSLGISGNGTFSGSAMTGLSSAGDQVVVFQDSDGPGGSAPQNNPSYIHILNSASRDKGNNCDFTDSNETNAPPSLTPVTFGDGQGTFLALGTGIGCDDENDQLYYNGGTSFPDAASARASILDPDNWVGTGTVVTIPPPAYFNARNNLISAGDLIAAGCVDATPPTITCPGTQTRSVNTSCNYTLEAFTSLATGVTDDCGPIIITQNPASGSSLSSLGNNTVTLTATDGSGKTSQCTFTLTLQDVTAPSISCPSFQFETADANCEITLADYTSLAGINDNCDANPSITQSPAPGTTTSSNTTVTLTATDASGNSTTCTFTVELEEFIAPSITCPGTQTQTASADCTALILDYTGLATVSDNCDATPTVEQNFSPGTAITDGTTVTLTVFDASNNTNSCTFTVELEDNLAPIINCPPTQQLNLDAACQVALIDYTGFPFVFDACDGNPTVTQSPIAGTTISNNTTVILTATDASGNSTTCTFTVELDDITAPSITCPGNQSEPGNANSEATLSDYTSLAVTNDNCDANPMVTQSPAPGTTFTGSTTVSLSVTDASSNINACSFTVVASDVTAPTITCPVTQSESADGNCEATLSDYTSLATVNDNNDQNPTVTQSPASGTTISSNTTVTLTATDVSGNSSSCTLLVELVDSTPPSITCPGTQTLIASDNCDARILDYTGLAIVSDNCDNNLVVTQNRSPGSFVSNNAIVELFVRDASNNSNFCNFTVVLEDNLAPTVDCPSTQLLEVDASCQASLIDYTFILNLVNDNCDGQNLTLTQSPAAGTIISSNTEVTLVVTDASSNSTSCIFTVELEDTTPPSITCPTTQSVSVDANCETILADYTSFANVSDNCDANPMINQNPPAGTTISSNTTVVLTATDASGLLSSNFCTFTVELLDNTPPVISCQSATTIDLNANGEAPLSLDFVFNDILISGMDNCGFDNGRANTDAPDFDCSTLGVTPVRFFFFDVNGNQSFCDVDITINDPLSVCNSAPSAVCQNLNLTADASCQANAAAADFDGGSSDPDGDNLTFSVSPVGPYGIGTTNVVLTVSDGTLSSTCNATVTVVDGTAPSITCPGTQLETADANCEATLGDYTGLATASDNCDANPRITQSPTAGTTISSNTTVTLTATDASGNSNTCTFTVELDDITAPSITCPGTQSETADVNCEATLGDYTGLATASDNCDANPVVTQSPVAGTTISSNTTVTLTATDASGNSTSCTITVEIDDTTAPSITCPGTQSEKVDTNCLATLVDYTSLAIVSDNCDANPIVTQSPVAGTTISSNTTVTLTATDVSGNSNTCTFTVELDDNTPPTISCPAAITIECGASTDPSNTGSATGSDNCNLTITFTDVVTPGACSQGASIERTWKADDGSGNMVTCVQIITINDPVVDCSTISNLAVNGTASQSSTYSSGAAGFANDDNLTGDNPNGASANLQHTQDADFQSWWEVDLGQLSDVQNVRIYNRTTSSSFLLGRLNNFWVFVSAQPFSGSLQDLINNPNIEQFFFDGTAGSIEDIALSGIGQYVRVQKSGVGPLHMAEVQVNGCIVNGTPINVPPTAAFTAVPNSGFSPLDVDFDATASFDPDGNITNYAWDFGDGNSGSGQMTAHTYTSAGTYTVELTVTDDDGAINTTTQTVIVSDPVGPCSNISNLAINGTASQSSTYSNGLALYANDGDLTGDDPHGANLQHTNNGEQEPWWEVDLGQQADIQDISIYNRTTSNAFLLGRLSDFWVFISAQPFSGSLQSLINDSSIDKYFFSGSAGSVENIPLSGLGRYVRIQKEGSSPLHMSEVQVNGCIDGNPPNIPPTAAFTANPTSGEAPLNVAFDAAASFDPDGTITTYFWDFGDGNTDTGVTTSNSYAAGTYSVTLTVTDNDGDTDTATETITVVEPNQGCGITANLALNGTASQSSTYGSGVASLANDGNTGGNNPNGATADLQHTQDADDESWWEVDLGQPSDIEGIRIYNRASTVPFLLNRLNNFWVFISDQPLVDDLQTNVNNTSVDKFFFSGNAGAIEDIALSGIGRYVRVQKTGAGPLHMAEVEVTGCNTQIPALNPEQVTTTPNAENVSLNDPNRELQKIVLNAAPNPFSNNFSLIVEGQVSENASIRIIDALGQVVYKANLNGANRLEIGQELNPGIYWIQLLSSGQMVDVRVVKSGN